VTNSKKTAGI